MYSQDWTKLEVRRCYRHFKGMLYYVFCVGRHTEGDREVLVTYQALYEDGEIHHRPFDMFIEKVPDDKQDENVTGQTYRFEPFDGKLIL
ncbi:DUF1653 domain-containing protein (plasmid) [Aneurinibacillus sp. Ricciae_BoGa-3]|uniref:DUF1653 domain-containing protein n=1 Tax=Aneurinibacillus sp. Ricciae_BoGa-3 TaxID=3022697 RepID=UPI00233F7EF1|nr:DUF1653 domain-containing protein [Aneurinibacillus sp. Ricciae_BoGa-3]WCK57251.1 DUF1653 domain-containing protein [Aneurinibacillus sp. Ricciae_BoGa-3]